MALSAVLYVGAGVSLGQTEAPATDDHPTAEQLYEQGMTQYGSGDLEGARATLRRVDAMQLPKEQRVRLYEVMQDIDRKGDTASDPTAVLDRAAKAQRDGQMARAAALYQQVIDSRLATPAQKDTAKARLAEVKRGLKPELNRMRQLVAGADEDLKKGEIDDADKKLATVRNSGVDLGWWDNERVDRLVAQVRERQAESAAMAAAAEREARPDVATDGNGDSAGQMAQADNNGDNGNGEAVEAQPMQPIDNGGATEATTEVTTETVVETTEPTGEMIEVRDSGTMQTDAAPEAGPDDVLARMKRLESQAKLAEGREAEQNGQFRVAQQSYQEAVRLDPNNQEASAALAAIEPRAAAAGGGGADAAPRGVLQNQLEVMGVRRAAALAEFEAAMNRAEELRTNKQFAQAMDATNQARTVLDRNEQYIPSNQYQSLRERATSLAATIEDERRIYDEQQRAELAAQQAKDAEIARERARLAQDEQVQALLRRALDLRKEQKYDQTLELVNQALFLDPNNIAAQAIKEMVEDSRLITAQREAIRKRNLEATKQSLENTIATIPFNELLVYPTDWPQLTEKRLRDLEADSGESQVNLQVRAKLRDPIPVNFQANKFTNVIDYFHNTTGLNFFVNWPALQQIGVEQETPITLDKLSNVPADRALDLVLKQVGTDPTNPVQYTIVEGIVTIDTMQNLSLTTETRVYDIRDLLHRVEPLQDVPSFDLSSALSNTSTGGGSGGSGGSTGGGSSGSGTSLFGDDSGSESDVDAGEARQEQIDDIVELIQTTVGRPEDWEAGGGTIGSIRELNGNLIVKTTAESHRGVLVLLGQLREARAMQISVEGRFLLVDQNFLEEVGVDLDIQITDPGGNFGPIGISQDTFGIAGRRTTGLPGGLLQSQATPGPGTFVPGTGFGGTNRSLDIGVSYLDDIQLNLIITATQYHQRSVSLTAPRVTFLNGQEAYVTVARQIAFISDLEPVSDAAGFDVTLSFVQSGMLLYVRGTVSHDRRYVTLSVRPELATVVQPIRRIEQVGSFDPGDDTGDDDDDDGEVFFSAFVEAPELELTRVETTVTVPDKGTLLLGGQRLVGEGEVEAGVPILSKIPILNRVFTNRSTVKDERTLLMLIKPTIIIQNEQEDELFPGLRENPTTYNIGRTGAP